MQTIWNIIRFVIVSLLAIVYWPINMLFLFVKKHYFIWKKEDRISYILMTPIYWLVFFLAFIISFPMDILGTDAHPPLSGFQ